MSTLSAISLDELIDRAVALCDLLPSRYERFSAQISALRDRLAGGKLQCAVLGQFNRGKSTFINALLRRDILPTSVLPLTSVPTTIRYGSREHVRISFLDGKAPVEIEGPVELLREALASHVTEEKNPQNCLNVKEATVAVSCELLQGGTILIDTPGFGSTFEHNSRTTFDLLSGCDVAFMVLSADLPITQVEVEFLRSVRVYVPRIFYIFNKRDLLTPAECDLTAAFIKETLLRTFGAGAEVRLFPVSARVALRQQSDEEAWRLSGMKEVQAAIEQFFCRDKYFSLARALNRKFLHALRHICSGLSTDAEHLRSELQGVRLHRETAHSHLTSLSSAQQHDSARAKLEHDELLQRVRQAIDAEILVARQAVQRVVIGFAQHERWPSRLAYRFEATLRELVVQTQRTMANCVVPEASALLKESLRQSRTIMEQFSSALDLAIDLPAFISPRLEVPEFECEKFNLSAIRLPLWFFCMPTVRRLAMLSSKVTVPILAYFERQLSKFAANIAARIDQQWMAQRQWVHTAFDELFSTLCKKTQQADAANKTRELDLEHQLAQLDDLLKKFSDITSLLCD